MPVEQQARDDFATAPPRLAISDGAILTVLASLGWSITYLFELGYAAFFDIPSGLISLDVTDTAATTVLLLVTVGSYILVIEAVTVVAPRLGDAARRLASALPAVTVLVLATWHVAVQWLVLRLIDVGGLLTAMLMLLVITYLAGSEKLRVATFLYPKFGPRRLTGFIALSCIILLMYFAYRSGYVSASTQRHFQVTSTGRVLLRTYGSNVVTIAIRDKQALRPIFVDGPATTYATRKVGPLLKPPKP